MQVRYELVEEIRKLLLQALQKKVDDKGAYSRLLEGFIVQVPDMLILEYAQNDGEKCLG